MSADAWEISTPDGPIRYAVEFGWLVQVTDRHTCAGGTPEAGGAHEPSCGLEPIIKLDELHGLLTSDRRREYAVRVPGFEEVVTAATAGGAAEMVRMFGRTGTRARVMVRDVVTTGWRPDLPVSDAPDAPERVTVLDWTAQAVDRFQYTGEPGSTLAVEEWAATHVANATGKTPTMAVFTGDCHGIYVEPHRLRDMGIESRYSGPVHVPHGGWVEWTGREFVVAAPDEVANAVGHPPHPCGVEGCRDYLCTPVGGP